MTRSTVKMKIKSGFNYEYKKRHDKTGSAFSQNLTQAG